MREKMTHFSREIARNARKSFWPIWGLIWRNFSKFQVKITFIEVLRVLPFQSCHISNSYSMYHYPSYYFIKIAYQKVYVFVAISSKKQDTNGTKLVHKRGLILPYKFFNFWPKWAPNWLIFLAISRGCISREKCLAKPFPVLARNARNVHV